MESGVYDSMEILSSEDVWWASQLSDVQKCEMKRCSCCSVMMIVFRETNVYIAGCINLCDSDDDEANENADGDRSACEEERVIMQLFALCGFEYCTVSQKEPAMFCALF